MSLFSCSLAYSWHIPSDCKLYIQIISLDIVFTDQKSIICMTDTSIEEVINPRICGLSKIFILIRDKIYHPVMTVFIKVVELVAQNWVIGLEWHRCLSWVPSQAMCKGVLFANAAQLISHSLWAGENGRKGYQLVTQFHCCSMNHSFL